MSATFLGLNHMAQDQVNKAAGNIEILELKLLCEICIAHFLIRFVRVVH